MSPICVQFFSAGLPSGTYRPTTYTKIGTITRATEAYDTSTTTYAVGSAVANQLPTALCGLTVSGFTAGTYSGTLTVRRAYSLTSNYVGGYTSSCGVKIAYSVDGGSSWTTMLLAESMGGENDATVPAGDITATLSGVDLSLLRVSFVAYALAGLDERDFIVAGASCYFNAYDVRVE